MSDHANKYTRVVAFKFGGSSLLGAQRMLHAAGLVRAAAKKSSVCVVVSAMKGVTDPLLAIEQALTDPGFTPRIDDVPRLLDLFAAQGERAEFAERALLRAHPQSTPG